MNAASVRTETADLPAMPAIARARGDFILPLQGMRGLAALWVALMHVVKESYFTSLAAFLPAPLTNTIFHGYTGVDIFFVLSGFVMCHVYKAQFDALGWRAYPHFLLIRLGRIYPLHLLILLIYGAVALVYVFTGRALDPQRYSAACFAESVLLVHSWGWRDYTLCWNIVSWSISAEWMAYLAFPLVLILLRRRIAPWLCLLATLACSLAIIAIMIDWLGLAAGAVYGPANVMRMAGGFLAGCLAFSAYRSAALRTAPWGALGGAAFVALIVLCALNMPYAALVPLPLLVLGIAYDRGWLAAFLRSRTMLFMGDISYALYMVHWLMWDGFIRWRMAAGDSEFGPSDPLAGAAIVTALMIAVIAAGTVLHYGFERPARSWVRRWADALYPHASRPSRRPSVSR